MATSKSQRIGILIITFVMIVGTIGSFAVMILSSNNSTDDLAKQQAAQKEMEEYQKKVEAQNKELSSKYFEEVKSYASRPAEFNKDEVTELKTEDLKEGDGEVIGKDTKYSAYYIGWNPSGKVFDQSLDGDKLKSPLPGGNMIEGWNEGVLGMKIGGVRELTIPAAKAYGEKGSGADIPANTPLKFVVIAIPQPEQISMPMSAYTSNGGVNVGQ